MCGVYLHICIYKYGELRTALGVIPQELTLRQGLIGFRLSWLVQMPRDLIEIPSWTPPYPSF